MFLLNELLLLLQCCCSHTVQKLVLSPFYFSHSSNPLCSIFQNQLTCLLFFLYFLLGTCFLRLYTDLKDMKQLLPSTVFIRNFSPLMRETVSRPSGLEINIRKSKYFYKLKHAPCAFPSPSIKCKMLRKYSNHTVL